MAVVFDEEPSKIADYNNFFTRPIPVHLSEPPSKPHIDAQNDSILDTEPKPLEWDGPVWCRRYGRYENREDAAADDGYRITDGPPHEDLHLHRCAKHNCDPQHHSYIKDIQRRVEPMVDSLVRLEGQVEMLVRHMVKDSGAIIHHHHHHQEGLTPPLEDGAGFTVDEKPVVVVARGKEEPVVLAVRGKEEPMAQTVARLEKRVEELMVQIQKLGGGDGAKVGSGGGPGGSGGVAVE